MPKPVQFRVNGAVSYPYCDVLNEHDDIRHILMKCRKYDIQINVFRNFILKYFGAFTMGVILSCKVP